MTRIQKRSVRAASAARKYFPAAAVAMLAMLVPTEKLPGCPIKIVCGAALYVLLALLLFQRRSFRKTR